MTALFQQRIVVGWLTAPILFGLALGSACAREFAYVSIRLDSALKVSGWANTETLSEANSELTINDVVHRITICPKGGGMVCFCTPAYCFAVPASVDGTIRNWSHGEQRFSIVDAPTNAFAPLPGVVFIESTFLKDSRRRILFLYSLKRGLLSYTLISGIGTENQATALVSSVNGVGFGCQQCDAQMTRATH